MTAPPPQNQLKRVVGIWGAVWLGLGSILGTGVFVSLGIAAGIVGQGLLYAVALASLVAVANGLSSAQLAAAHPVSGGTYEYGYRFVHPHVGFAAGWMFLSAKSASAATAALGCAGYLLHTLSLPDTLTVRIGLALCLVLTLTSLVSGGLRRSNAANVVIVSTTLLALSCFVVFGALSISENATVSSYLPTADTVTWSSLGHATALMFVAYTGYGRVATLGEEIENPSRNIPKAVVLTLLVSMLLYLAVSATAIAVVGPRAFAVATSAAAAPLEIVAESFAIRWVAPFIAVGAITAMAGVLLNLLLGLSRVLLAMARRRDMPVFLGFVRAKDQSPSRAVWAIGALIGGLVLLGDVKTTWTFSAFTVLVYYGITNLAALKLPPAARLFPRFISMLGLGACFSLALFLDFKISLLGVALLASGFALRRALKPSSV